MSKAPTTFETVDWTDVDSIISIMPEYVQAKHAIKKARKKVNNNVNIEGFALRTPTNDKYIFNNTSLVLEGKVKSCVYGANGAGKTQLFLNIAEGKIKDFPKHIHVHHCEEIEHMVEGEAVIDTVLNSYPHLNLLNDCKAKLTTLLETEADAATKEKFEASMEYIETSLRGIRAFDAKKRVTAMLRVLGFDSHGQSMPTTALSGGLRMRVALAIAFFIDPELLLLDEPTNHLDFPSVLWLENRLRGYRGAFLLVTHDRELLENVCHQVMLLEDQKIVYYNCSFKEFEKKKKKADEKKFNDIEKFLVRNKNVDFSTPLGKQKMEMQKWSNAYYSRQVALASKFTFPRPVELEDLSEEGTEPGELSLINLVNLRFSYDPTVEDPVFIFNEPIDFNVRASTRMGVMGPNGAGKSTLLKLLTGKLTPTEGKVTPHPNYTLAYFGQHSTQELDLDLTPFEFMKRHFGDKKGKNDGQLKGHLAKTSIVGEIANTRMRNLSFSQRSCVIFSKLTFVCPHLLIMDEPTNFLDLESVDALIGACHKYNGALLIVSHNRDFLKKCSNQYLSIVPGHFAIYDDMKTAERATYSFISMMESGDKIDAAAQLGAGGGTRHDKGEDEEADAGVTKDADGGISLGAYVAPPKKKKKEKTEKKEKEMAVGDNVEALYAADGNWYAASIQKVLKSGFQVLFTEYGNSEKVATDGVRAIKKAKKKKSKAKK